MYTLPNFCRVCLKYDKNLIDLEHIENEPNETLMSKLQQLVTEVEWKVLKPLLCHPCIKRLNIAYTFKKQCVQSVSMLKSYVALVSKTKESDEEKGDTSQSNAYMMLPNQKYIKIVVGPPNENTFQSVFLNVVPPLNPISDSKKDKDTNQNVFLNINSTIQKFVPEASNISELLTESKSEELSVEIDPTDFGLGEDNTSEWEDSPSENGVNDWEDVISAAKIAPKLNGSNVKESRTFGNYVPILPKQEKMDFSNSGEHFLSSPLASTEFGCEKCQKSFSSKITLKHHIKNFHMGKYPFKCEFCYTEFMVRSEYDTCIKFHKFDQDPANNSLTLSDFKEDCAIADQEVIKDPTELVCNICHRQFNSPSGLLRHKVRKHNQQSKKKYFIKGMKNAKCDICNREFSTQSYMQLHRKLHLRDDIGYKYKVFGKNRYIKYEEKKDDDDDGIEKDSNNMEEEAKESKEEDTNSENEKSDN